MVGAALAFTLSSADQYAIAFFHPEYRNDTDSAPDFWTTAEVSIGVVASCLPPLGVLLRKMPGPSKFYGYLRPSGSSRFNRRETYTLKKLSSSESGYRPSDGRCDIELSAEDGLHLPDRGRDIQLKNHFDVQISSNFEATGRPKYLEKVCDTLPFSPSAA